MFLLDFKEISPNVMDNGEPLIFIPIKWNLPEILDLLIDYGADVNMTDDTGKLPIVLAQELHRFEISQILKKAGATDLREDAPDSV